MDLSPVSLGHRGDDLARGDSAASPLAWRREHYVVALVVGPAGVSSDDQVLDAVTIEDLDEGSQSQLRWVHTGP